MKSLFRLLFVLAALGLSQLAFAEGEASQSVGSIPTSMHKLSASEIKDVLSTALIKKGWQVLEKTDEKVVGYLKHRNNEAQITLSITKDAIEMSCWGYEINKNTGERRKPEQPVGWIKFLKGDIQRLLNETSSKKI